MNRMLEMKDIKLSFEGKNVLRDFSLSINEGEKVLLYGTSGKGKTSILRLILGFVEADRGDVLFRNSILKSSNVWDIRKEIAYVPQNTHLGDESVGDIINYARLLRANRDSCCSRDHIEEILASFHLSKDIVKKKFNELSGGEKQRVLLTIALSLNRAVYLLDEPTASLDKAMKEHTVERFCSMSDATVIVVSHDEVWLRNNVFRRIDI